MNRAFYDSKIIILDLDLISIGQLYIDDFLLVRKVLNELSANQHLILLTDNSLTVSLRILDSLDLKSGYLVADSGATVVNISSKKILREWFLNGEMAKRVAYSCIWNNLSFSLNVKDKDLCPFRINDWLFKKCKFDLTHLSEFSSQAIYDVDGLKKCLEEIPLKTIEIYFLEKNDAKRKHDMSEFSTYTDSFSEFKTHTNGSTLYILPNKCSKYRSVVYLAETMQWDFEKGSLYCGISHCNTCMCEHSYFSAVTEEALRKPDYGDLSKDVQITTIPLGNNSWIKWFQSNTHLWKGEEEEIFKSIVNKNMKAISESVNLDDLRNKKVKYLSWNVHNYDGNEIEEGSRVKQSINIAVWPNQITRLISIISPDKNRAKPV